MFPSISEPPPTIGSSSGHELYLAIGTTFATEADKLDSFNNFQPNPQGAVESVILQNSNVRRVTKVGHDYDFQVDIYGEETDEHIQAILAACRSDVHSEAYGSAVLKTPEGGYEYGWVVFQQDTPNMAERGLRFWTLQIMVDGKWEYVPPENGS